MQPEWKMISLLLVILGRGLAKQLLCAANGMNQIVKTITLAASAILGLGISVFAGSPFLTDDPEPIDYQHWEAYLFTAGDYARVGHDRTGFAISGPAVEMNYGVLPDTQLHAIATMTTVGGSGMGSASGFGDMEIGAKYRFVHEQDIWAQVGIFPATEVPTGDSSHGLGNGRAWFRLPLWAQKSWGPWTSDIGAGEALNSAPGQRNYSFGGWLLQRSIGPRLSLGGEVFAQSAPANGVKGFVAVNFGGTYNFNEHFSLLMSAGHSILGEPQMLWYCGLYWTWCSGEIAQFNISSEPGTASAPCGVSENLRWRQEKTLPSRRSDRKSQKITPDSP